MDKFYTQQYCDRCKGTLENGRMMSRFNTDCLCMECIKKEKELPEYKKAVEVEMEEIKKGNYNFKGIGYPKK
jgi:hypothetical protein